VAGFHRILLPLERNAAVNVWLLVGDPLTLIDTGPRSAAALGALEDGLARVGVAVEDLELVLATHQHADHVGLAETIRRRANAEIAVLEPLAAYLERFGERVAAEKAFFRCTPALIQIVWFFYCVPMLFDVFLDAVTMGVLALGLNLTACRRH